MTNKVESNQYEAVIGLEIHAELKTASKMFCSCANDPFRAEPNVNICPICLGFPGTLPTPNKRAIELTLQVGRALNCQTSLESKFDRKNYFYPDLPKGYQISQYDLPLTSKGFLEVEGKRVRIRRVHLEEDTGKLLHQEGKNVSLVDYNRAGVPLIELVTEPDITSPRQASAFAKELQQILRYTGASNADMEKGEMRVEANVSVRRRLTTQQSSSKTYQLGTKVEIKNLNSFRSVERAIAYEVARQIESLEKGQKLVQETRGWDEGKGRTFPQRTKEEAEDYRYFPEPDIPPLAVSSWEVKDIEKPDERRKRYREKYGLAEKQAAVLVASKDLADLFEDVVQRVEGLPAVTIANWIINEGVPVTADRQDLAQVLNLLAQKKITAPMAKEQIKRIKVEERITVTEKVRVIIDENQIDAIIDDILSRNVAAVADVKRGKTQALDFLVGQVMAKTKGQADPQQVNKILRKKLE